MMAAGAPMGSLSPWKQNTDGDMYQVYKPRASPKPRQTSSSPRYVRTWSQEEEAYLLEARGARVPYKDIAARLNKTDLACRLHFHQMVNARKNAIPEESPAAPNSEQYSMPYHLRSDSLPPITTAVPSQMLLPAPIIREMTRTGSGTSALNPNSHRRTTSQPQTQGKRQTTPSPPLGGIAKQSPVSSSRRQSLNPSVDVGRVKELYKDLAPHFWQHLASQYSQDKSISPSDVETAFFQGQGLGLSHSGSLSPHSSIETSPAMSWQGTMSSTSPASSHMAVDERPYQLQDRLSTGGNKGRISMTSLLNNN